MITDPYYTPNLAFHADHPQERAPAALLWDVDNVIVPKRHMPTLIAALKVLVEADEPLIAAAHRHTYRANRFFLADHGFEVLSGGRRASGADKELIRRARQLTRCGVRMFIVASNDGRFAVLARIGEVHVATTQPALVSQRLAAVVAKIHTLSPCPALELKGERAGAAGPQSSCLKCSISS